MLKKYFKKNIFLNKLRKRIFYKTKFTQDKNKKMQFWTPIWTNLFAQNPKQIYMRPKMTPIGWSLVWKKQTPALKKTEKTRWFLMLLGPETSQETHKKPKRRPRKHPKTSNERKKTTKKKQKNASVVKNALAWR